MKYRTLLLGAAILSLGSTVNMVGAAAKAASDVRTPADNVLPINSVSTSGLMIIPDQPRERILHDAAARKDDSKPRAKAKKKKFDSVTTHAIGEEDAKPYKPQPPQQTTMAIGEEDAKPPTSIKPM